MLSQTMATVKSQPVDQLKQTRPKVKPTQLDWTMDIPHREELEVLIKLEEVVLTDFPCCRNENEC